jgi:branched-chain amino acid transport system permease protein
MARWRPYLLGLLGVVVITFPFLWLKLQPNFADHTIQTVWAPDHGLQFFSDLLPVFLVGLLIWLGVRANRFWKVSGAVARTAAWQGTEKIWSQYWAWIAMALVLAGPFGLSASTLGLLTNVGIFMLLALGLNITVGMTGLLVLGYAGFYAFGGYFFAIGQQDAAFFPWWLAALLAFPIGGVMGYLLGLPCLRLRGDYLAIVTLGFAEAFRETIKNLGYDGTLPNNLFSQFIRNSLDHFFHGPPPEMQPTWHSFTAVQDFKFVYLWISRQIDTHGAQGIIIKTDAMLHRLSPGISSGDVAYVVVALVLFVTVFFVQRLYHSPIGRAWIAIRENEIAAASVGVPVVQMKLLAFSLSAGIAAVAGVLSGAHDGLVSPAMCEFQTSIIVLAMVILGGLGNTYGALLGAALLYLVPEYLKRVSMMQDTAFFQAMPNFLRAAFLHLADYQLLIFGIVMVIMMLYRPQGLLGSSRRKEEILNQ